MDSCEQEEQNMERDLCEKRFFSDEERFSDLFNGIIFRGERILKPEELMELDTQNGMWRRPVYSSKTKNGARDLVRRTAMGMNFVICGLENQEIVDYGSPLRILGYDVSEYERQAALIRKQIRDNISGRQYSKGEYLYGFARDSKLQPTITLMLYYGENWDGPRDLYGMIDFTDIPEKMKQFIPNYRLNLVDIRSLADTTVFQTDVKQVFDFIRYSKKKDALEKLIETDPYYKNMKDDAYDMVSFYTSADMLIAKKKEYKEGAGYNMCKALDDIYEAGREEERKHTEEERKRTEEERKRTEEERKRAEEERKRAEEERKRAEEEKKRAEEERREKEEALKRVRELEAILEDIRKEKNR